MFRENHYVPILRHKRAEMGALRNTSDADSKNITPLIEFRPNLLDLKSNPKFEADLDFAYELVKRTAEAWTRPYFVDFGLDEYLPQFQSGKHPLCTYFNELSRLHFSAIPTTGLRRARVYQNAVAETVNRHNSSLCLRLNTEDLYDHQLHTRISQLVANVRLTPQEIHLIVDLGITKNISLDFGQVSHLIPHLSKWKTFSLASGAFPQDLTGFTKNGEYFVSRDDFEFWQRSLITGHGRFRLPSFSDYTIQFAEYREPPPDSNPSASIRYTHDRNWVIMRGEGLKNPNGPKNKQYWALATLLVDRTEYCGRDFSIGDDYVFSKTVPGTTFGSPETWLNAGISHHLAFASRQVARQFEPSEAYVSVSKTVHRPLMNRQVWNRARIKLPSSRTQTTLFYPSS